MRMRIEGGRALVGGSLEETSVDLDYEGRIITGIGAQARAERTIDARGLLVLPGIVDVHRRLRATDDAAAGRGISDRRCAARKRSTSRRQRHHDRLSWRDVVVGRRP